MTSTGTYPVLLGVERMDWPGRRVAARYRFAAAKLRSLSPRSTAARRRYGAVLGGLTATHAARRPTLLAALVSERRLEDVIAADPASPDATAARPVRIRLRYAIDGILLDDSDGARHEQGALR